MDTIRKISYIFSKKQKFRMLLQFFVILIGAILELLAVTVVMPLVEVIMQPGAIYTTRYLNVIYTLLGFTSEKYFLIFLVILLICIYIIKNLYLSIMYNLQYHFTFSNQRVLATRMLSCYLRQPYYFHVVHSSAELMRNINSDTTMLFQVVLAFMDLLTEVTVCLALGIFLFIKDKSITIGILLVFVIFLLLFYKGFRQYLNNIGRIDRKFSAGITKWLQQSLGGIKEAKILGREEFFVNKFDYNYKNWADCERKYRFLQVVPRPAMETVCIVGLMSVVAFKLLMGTTSSYFVTTLSVFVVAAFRLLPSFNRIASQLGAIMFSKSAIDSVYYDLKEIENINEVIMKKSVNVSPIKFELGIKVKDLTFRYPEAEYNVLENVNLFVPKKKSVALIGASGAGKTTLADILLGALEPLSGEVLADDINIFSNIDEWHKSLGYIPQSIYLMDDTIRNNITFGINENEIDTKKIDDAIEKAQLKDFIASLPEGLDTEIGERGIKLSGGQRQRIGIARALYSDPEVLVLDEATSALDNDTEEAVMYAIDSLSGSKTLIIIAHRLSTIRNCDLVYEVKDRKVIQRDKNLVLGKV